ncbi:aminotransferase class I/II-fold pyridoxal phosphate-dependent enzyme [Loktanella sp. R86503]|uniref:aminotransferase class I/II-fold pyridoxal phosphate-dependent enzyme n=1 Tax=Loktanella sp. R86503 TaxID=3093847 RepID=UPI0036D99C62
MEYPKRFANLPVATWPRLRGLLDAVQPGGDPINMTIGDPKHAMPSFLAEAMTAQMAGFGSYPNNDGAPALLDAISRWVARRYGITVTANEIMSLNGTREGLYNASMALCPEVKNGQTPVILTPNPFYQVYAVAALSVGAEPVYLPATAETGHLPNFDAVPADVLDRTAIAYICSPANPQGAVATEDYWRNLIALAEKHDFKIFADECYSEIYRGTAPVGALQVAQAMGADPERVAIFHSLSKRSNLAGLRSGFCASGPKNIAAIRALRAYAGAPLPGPIQAVSALVWDDEDHVTASRALYAEKFDIADRILGDVPNYTSPEAGFFLWLPVPDGEQAALTLWAKTGVRTLPGAYLSRDVSGFNPGAGFIRVALCGPKSDVERGLTRLRDTVYQ